MLTVIPAVENMMAPIATLMTRKHTDTNQECDTKIGKIDRSTFLRKMLSKPATTMYYFLKILSGNSPPLHLRDPSVNLQVFKSPLQIDLGKESNAVSFQAAST